MVAESVVSSVRRYLSFVRENGVPVTFGVIFGSQASGKADEWSDIDLIVVSPRFDHERRRDDAILLGRFAARTDTRLEPIPCGERQWEEDDSTPIIEIARRTGERVTP